MSVTASEIASVLDDLDLESSSDDVLVQSELSRAVVRVSVAGDELQVALVEVESWSPVLSRIGRTIGTVVRKAAGWEDRLRARVADIGALAEDFLPCRSCGSFMILADGVAACADCPHQIEHRCSCGAPMSLLQNGQDQGTFWGCSTHPRCRKAQRWGAVQGEGSEAQRFRDADGLLARAERGDYGDKMALLASKLRKVLEQDRDRGLSMILGEKSPTGKRTLEAIMREREEGIAAARKRRSRRRATRMSVKLPADPFKGLGLYEEVDRPGRELTVIEIPKEGGPTRPASDFPCHELQYDTLNPMQAQVLPWIGSDVNLVVATKTSTGKTTVAEMMGADALRRKGKVIFLSPLRAVSQEKFDDWRSDDHPWGELRVEICTGDYTLTDAKRKKLKRANVIVMTSEMLDSKTRRMANEGNDWLLRTLCLVVDEAHLLTMAGRGDALEVGLMRFTSQNPHARVVLLSATMPNVDELGGWLTRLNGKPSVVIKSEWRPTELTVHWPIYRAGGNYAQNEESKREAAMDLLHRYSRDKWIVFVHSKKAGRALVRDLREEREEVEFHSADLNRDSRLELERRFRHGDLRICVATSTLAYGINMPARRVLVLGIHRGMSEVDPIDVAQEVGRAGRVGFDPRGDAYVLLPGDPARPSKTAGIRRRFQQVGRIESRINDVDVLAFHLTAEVAEGDVESEQEAVSWHDRSLAAFQGAPLVEDGHEVSAAKVMAKLARAGILKKTGLRYEATMLGRVSSWLYYSPFDVSDWAGNFRRLVEMDRLKSDECVAWAVGCVKTAYDAWTPREAEADLSDLVDRLRALGVDKRRLPTMVLAAERLLSGETNYKPLISAQRSIAHDASRISQAISLIDKHVLKSLGQTYCDLIGIRLRYGCSWQEADLCRLPGIGARRAASLIEEGVCSIEDVARKKNTVREVVGRKLAAPAIRRAKELVGD